MDNNIDTLNLTPDKRTTWIEYKNEKILFQNYKDNPAKEGINSLEFASNIIKNQPINSVLNLIDVTNAKYNAETLEFIKKISTEDKDHIIKTAVVGLDMMKKISLNTVSLFSRRTFKAFETIDEALEWLISKK